MRLKRLRVVKLALKVASLLVLASALAFAVTHFDEIRSSVSGFIERLRPAPPEETGLLIPDWLPVPQLEWGMTGREVRRVLNDEYQGRTVDILGFPMRNNCIYESLEGVSKLSCFYYSYPNLTEETKVEAAYTLIRRMLLSAFGAPDAEDEKSLVWLDRDPEHGIGAVELYRTNMNAGTGWLEIRIYFKPIELVPAVLDPKGAVSDWLLPETLSWNVTKEEYVLSEGITLGWFAQSETLMMFDRECTGTPQFDGDGQTLNAYRYEWVFTSQEERDEFYSELLGELKGKLGDENADISGIGWEVSLPGEAMQYVQLNFEPFDMMYAGLWEETRYTVSLSFGC